MHYTLHQLQIFLKIAETGSVTKAAEELHLTQPAVSIQLKNFQDQFDVPITEVVGRKMYVTDFGKELVKAAERIVLEVEKINQITTVQKGKLVGKLKVSSVSTGKYVMPYFLTKFMSLHPEVELAMDVTNKQRVIKNLERNEVDFALVSILPDHLSLNKIDLLINKLYLVGVNPVPKSAASSPGKLFKELPLIFREPGSGTRQAMERFIDKHHLLVRKKMELTSNEAVKQALLAGLGYSIMPLIGIQNELEKRSLQIIPVKGLPIKTMWQLTWPKGKQHSPVASAFLHYVQNEKKEIIKQFFPLLNQFD